MWLSWALSVVLTDSAGTNQCTVPYRIARADVISGLLQAQTGVAQHSAAGRVQADNVVHQMGKATPQLPYSLRYGILSWLKVFAAIQKLIAKPIASLAARHLLPQIN